MALSDKLKGESKRTNFASSGRFLRHQIRVIFCDLQQQSLRFYFLHVHLLELTLLLNLHISSQMRMYK